MEKIEVLKLKGLIESGIKIRRYDASGLRRYYTLDQNGNVEKLYESVTSFIKQVTPTPVGLQMWMKEKSYDEQQYIMKTSACYGTAIDILFNQLIIEKKVSSIEKVIDEQINIEQLFTVPRERWYEQAKKDLLSFKQFCLDYEVTPIAVSTPVKSDEWGVAGTLDLLCTMYSRLPTKTIKPERVIAIVDYKSKIGIFDQESTRNNFYESEGLQLVLYKQLVEETFGIQVECLYNFSPKNWKTKPSYNVKDWSNQIQKLGDKIVYLRALYLIDNPELDKQVVMVDNEITLDNNDNFKIVSLSQLINNENKTQKQ